MNVATLISGVQCDNGLICPVAPHVVDFRNQHQALLRALYDDAPEVRAEMTFDEFALEVLDELN
jgi:hypothetical protein